MVAIGNQNPVRKCWCGSGELRAIFEHYAECRKCGTAVLISEPPSASFYSMKYWSDYQQKHHGFPSIVQRARLDLPERCMYWLGYLLRFVLPPAAVLEVGCAHGAFLHCCRTAGFDSVGVEIAPEVIKFATETFGIRVHAGPVEICQFEPASFDAVILMDVLEHFFNPEETMVQLAKLANKRPDGGLLFIQTPRYASGRTSKWPQFKPPEHLYLFTKCSLTSLLCRIGFKVVRFLTPIYGQAYDMYCVASRGEIREYEPKQIEDALLMTPGGRLMLAMLDLYWQGSEPYRPSIRRALWQLICAVNRSVGRRCRIT